MRERGRRAYALDAALKTNQKRLTIETLRATALSASTLGFFILGWLFEYSANAPFGALTWKHNVVEISSKLVSVAGTLASALALSDQEVRAAFRERRQLINTVHNNRFHTHGAVFKRIAV